MKSKEGNVSWTARQVKGLWRRRRERRVGEWTGCRWSNGKVGEWAVMATEGLENELWCRCSDRKVGEWAELIVIVIAELIIQPFRHFSYVTTHYPTVPLLHLRHSSSSNPSFASATSQQSSFSNLSVTSPTSQLILQPFRCFTHVTVHSPTLLSLVLRHKLFT